MVNFIFGELYLRKVFFFLFVVLGIEHMGALPLSNMLSPYFILF